MKSNANDVGRSFYHKQAALAWLSGDTSGYSAGEWVTKNFPSGHFDRPAQHLEGRQVPANES
eukprot:6218923-Pyramimonas_sp.AAC.1